MKLPNKYGSVYSLGKGRRKPFVAMITTGWIEGSNGEHKQVRKALGYFKTRKEAMLCLAEYNSDPYDLDINKITFAEVYNKWSKTAYDDLSDSTIQLYKIAYNRCEPIWDMPMKDIRLSHLQEIIDGMENLSYSSINLCKVVIGQIFKYAMRNDLIKKDYSSLIIIKKKREASEKHKPFTTQEIKRLWENAHNRYVKLVLILIYTGVRPSELTGMLRENVHIDEHYMIGGVKTESSKNRIIPIHDDIYGMVKGFYNEGGTYLYMHNGIDKPVSVQGFIRLMKNEINPILKSEHLPHDGRHTFATMSKGQVEDFYISKIMGHRLDKITESVYTHVTPEVLVEQVNKIKFK